MPLRDRVWAACEAAGRDPATLGLSVAVLVDLTNGESAIPEVMSMGIPNPLKGPPEAIATALRGYAEVGVSHLQVFPFPLSPRGIERFQPVLELLDA